ncbi:AAA family ATPase [[Clostridium] fimetarium]|uniref:Twinkle protein n=1 Tax=[Clostridium] fimetarium TaxID=99656 RepID=A0A1I0LZT1_9FIRM|nr:AAA family ATPase [[Clostridium] fimetarium]SEV81608.1 twinkle protein [[Clostridium] fimetarium]
MEAETKGVVIKTEKTLIDEEIARVNRELNELGDTGQEFASSAKQGKRNNVDLSKELNLQATPQLIEEPVFLTPTQIKTVKRDLSQVIKSGIHLLDKRIMGFNKGELSVWSGSNGSGKSSILSQLAIESIENNFKVALYSGELRADRVLNWVQLQAAGIKNVTGTKYENFYTVPEGIRAKINEWLESSLYIYNNDYGARVENVLKAVTDSIEKFKIDVVIIDNLMSLDLTGVTGEKYDKQTNLVIALSQLAKKKNIHIHFVAHPRKSLGFLRKQDISGTADITNLADNVFLIHRCNTDFKKGIMEHLGVNKDNLLLKFDNVIEVAKNRDLGIADEFIGAYYEKESKRFLNSIGEEKHYFWERDKNGFIGADNTEIPFKN